MGKKTTKIIAAILLFALFITSVVKDNKVYEVSVNKDTYKSSNIVDKKDINDELLDGYNQGLKSINIFVDNNKISFEQSNTYTELNYSLYNIIMNSDKESWNITTNNNVNKYQVINNEIVIEDTNVDTISFSFIYNNQEYNLSLIKNVENYVLVESRVKLIHGNINSLWYDYYYNLEDAIKASSDNDYIVLYDNINVDKVIDVNKNITIMSKPGNIFTVFNNNDFMFNLRNEQLNLVNVVIECDSFVKGKTKSINLDNSKIVYKDRLYPKKNILKNKINTNDDNVFIKASL